MTATSSTDEKNCHRGVSVLLDGGGLIIGWLSKGNSSCSIVAVMLLPSDPVVLRSSVAVLLLLSNAIQLATRKEDVRSRSLIAAI
jgi:hypothetical protein